MKSLLVMVWPGLAAGSLMVAAGLELRTAACAAFWCVSWVSVTHAPASVADQISWAIDRVISSPSFSLVCLHEIERTLDAVFAAAIRVLW